MSGHRKPLFDAQLQGVRDLAPIGFGLDQKTGELAGARRDNAGAEKRACAVPIRCRSRRPLHRTPRRSRLRQSTRVKRQNIVNDTVLYHQQLAIGPRAPLAARGIRTWSAPPL